MPSTRRTAAWHGPVPPLLLATGALNLAPALLAAAPGRFLQVYGVAPDSPATELLLRHRAVLLGLVGAALVAAAHVPALRRPALAGAAVSKLSFLALVGGQPPNAALRRVARADAIGLAGLALTAVAGAAGSR